MADAIGSAYVEIGADTSKFEKSLAGLHNNLAGSLTSLASRATGILASVFAVQRIYSFAKETATLNARIETLGVVLGVVGKNAGYSAAEMQMYANQVKAMGITTQESYSSIIKMTQANLDLSNASKLARVSQDAAVIGNINSSQALERIVHGIKTAQTEVLRTIGINVNFEKSYGKLATALNKKVEALTEGEKAQARMNAVVEEGAKIEGAYEAAMGTVGKLMTSTARYVEELNNVIGEIFKPALGVAVKGFQEGLIGLERWFSEQRGNGNIEAWGNIIKEAFNFIVWSAKNLIDGVSAAIKYIIEYKEVFIALGVAIGAYYVANMVKAIQITSSFSASLLSLVATGLDKTIQGVSLFSQAISALTSPVGLVALALGGLTYIVVDHFNQIKKTEEEYKNFVKSVAGMDQETVDEQIAYWEQMRLEIEAIGGSAEEAKKRIDALKNRKVEASDTEEVIKGWKDIYEKGRGTAPGDISGGKGSEIALDPAKVMEYTKKNQDEYAKLTMSKIGLIKYEMEKEIEAAGGRAMLATVNAELLKKIETNAAIKITQIWKDRNEEINKTNIDNIKQNDEYLKSIEKQIMENKRSVEDIEKSHQERMISLGVKKGTVGEIDAIKEKEKLEIASLEREKEKINILLTLSGYDENLWYLTAEQLKLNSEQVQVLQKINNLKKENSEEILIKEIENERTLLEIRSRMALAELDMQEKYGTASQNEINRGRMEEQNNLLRAYNDELSKSVDETAKLKWKEKIEATTRAIIDLNYQQQILNGTFEEGIGQGIKEYYDKMKTTFDYGKEYVGMVTGEMKSAFSGIFKDMRKGEMKDFLDYFSDFTDKLADKWADMLSEMLVNWIITGNAMRNANVGGDSLGGFGGLLASALRFLGFGGGSLSTASTGSVGIPSDANYVPGVQGHSGGYIPEFHKGGLNNDEVFAKLQKGEYVVSRKGVAALDKINSGDVSNGSNVVVNIENKTGSEIRQVDQGTSFNGKTMVKNIMLELAQTDMSIRRKYGVA